MNQLVSASEEDPDLGFMARMMAICSLPRSNPGHQLQYVRRNGPFVLYMIAGGGNKLPFGNLPRLLLAWVSTEAVKTGRRELVLGKSLSEFMRTLDIYSNSGRVPRSYWEAADEHERVPRPHLRPRPQTPHPPSDPHRLLHGDLRFLEVLMS